MLCALCFVLCALCFVLCACALCFGPRIIGVAQGYNDVIFTRSTFREVSFIYLIKAIFCMNFSYKLVKFRQATVNWNEILKIKGDIFM